MNFDSKSILDFIRLKTNRPMKIRDLAKTLSIAGADYPRFRKIIKQLIETGELAKLKRNRVGLVSEMNIVVGKISITRSGTGFLIQDGDTEDILIPESQLFTALDGDRVMVRLAGFVKNRQAGTVIKIIERVERNLVGVFNKHKHFSYVKPDNPRIHRDIYIPPEDNLGARNNEKVVARLVSWDDPHLNPVGKIVERLGFAGDPGVDMLTVMRSYNLPEKFPAEVLEEAETVSESAGEEEYNRRLDLTSACIYTIDPFDAKDHDDAVSVEKTDSGYRLGVHIADVSFFVKSGTALDKEAFERGNSVYLPGMVVPMLPEMLSNNICSLKANKKRLAHSVLMDFDKKGKMLSWQRADTVIKSKAKLAYEQVQEFFDGNKSVIRSQKVKENLLVARELATLLNKRRFAEGSLDFDLPESKIVMNEKGEVLSLGSFIRLESHRLVEEFMLAANKAVALEVFRNGQKMLYRVHDKPDSEKLEMFSEMMKKLGYQFPVSKDMKPVQFAKFLDRIKDSPEADFINELMLRSMKKAVYQGNNIGHFGLAFSHYAHFTSPIRRYPDLLVHRLLRAMKKGRYPASFAKKADSIIENVGRHCSDTERIAEAAEREAVKVKQVAYMARHVGDEFPGVISGVTGYGFYVRLDNIGVEGMVRLSTIDDDYYNFDEKQYRLVGRRKSKVFRLGDRINVGILKVDTIKNEIDLFPVIKKSEIARKPLTKKKKRRKNKITSKV